MLGLVRLSQKYLKSVIIQTIGSRDVWFNNVRLKIIKENPWGRFGARGLCINRNSKKFGVSQPYIFFKSWKYRQIFQYIKPIPIFFKNRFFIALLRKKLFNFETFSKFLSKKLRFWKFWKFLKKFEIFEKILNFGRLFKKGFDS